MRLLVTVTVLYLVTSSVYSEVDLGDFYERPCPPCSLVQYCRRPGLCVEGRVKDRCGCCTVCAKVKGEKCERHGECARGLYCSMGIYGFGGVCLTKQGTKVIGDWCEETAECARGLECEIVCYRRYRSFVIKAPSSCSFAGKVIKNGESHTAKPYFYSRRPGCIKCTCRDGTCEYDSDAECPGQKKKKSCTSNSGEVVQHGHSYAYEGGCRECVCNDGVASCRDTGRCEEEEMNYKNCYHNGKEIKHDQSYNDDCNSCHCYNGKSACTMKACHEILIGVPKECYAPKKMGWCRARLPRFYFNPATGSCEQFDYGGCGGNSNNFVTLRSCLDRCVIGYNNNQVTHIPVFA